MQEGHDIKASAESDAVITLPTPEGTKYTCPMHPEIIRDEFGDCPLCGMALEPMSVPDGDTGLNPELVDFTKRFWLSAQCSAPLLLLAMGPMIGLPVRQWIIAPGLFPPSFRTPDGSVPVYFEAAAVIVALVFLGQVLELSARARTGSAIRALMAAEGVDVTAMMDTANALRSEGKTAIFVAIDGKAAGVIAVADPVKQTTPGAIKALHEAGLTIIMATGDNERTARAVAATLDIDEVRADLLPADKKELIDELKAQGRLVAMAGGILYPFFGLLLSPMIAAAAMSLSSVSVIGNALRLRKVRL